MNEPPQFKDYVVYVELLVTAPSEEEVQAALARSGVTLGELIGEALIQDVQVYR